MNWKVYSELNLTNINRSKPCPYYHLMPLVKTLNTKTIQSIYRFLPVKTIKKRNRVTMKNIYYLCLSLILISCGGQLKEKIIIDTPTMTEIKIVNKVNCSHAHLTKKEVLIEDKDEIEKIINLMKHSSDIKTHVNTKVNVGFFDMTLLDSNNTKYYYTILYTIYNGVILTDLNGSGNHFRNDRLEILIYKLFR